MDVLAPSDRAGHEDELGDVLFAVVNLARHLKVDPENALAAANRKFERRFRLMEQNLQADGSKFEGMSIEHFEIAWQNAKRELRK